MAEIKVKFYNYHGKYITKESTIEEAVKVYTDLGDVAVLRGTGLKDVDNNEIFEGDIVEEVNPVIGVNKWLIKYADGAFWYYNQHHYVANVMRSWPSNSYPMFRVQSSRYRIIGNFYTSQKELIKEVG